MCLQRMQGRWTLVLNDVDKGVIGSSSNHALATQGHPADKETDKGVLIHSCLLLNESQAFDSLYVFSRPEHDVQRPSTAQFQVFDLPGCSTAQWPWSCEVAGAVKGLTTCDTNTVFCTTFLVLTLCKRQTSGRRLR